MDNPKRKKILTAIAVLLAALSVFLILQTGYSYYISWKEAKLAQESRDLYNSIKEQAVPTPTPTPAPTPTPTPTPEIPVKPLPPQESEKEIRPEFQALMEGYNNEDIVGYIKIEGTTIDYPVLQWKDNDFYLNRDINKNNSSAGSIYLDYENDITKADRNTILYGHNMNANIMFHGLRYFQNEDYYKEHKYINFNTLYDDYVFEIFACYVTHINFNYIIVNFPSDDYFVNMVDTMLEKSLYDTGLEVGVEDRIITLSTCSNVDPNTRIVVNAKLIEVNGRAYTDILAEREAYEKALTAYKYELASMGISISYIPKEELMENINNNCRPILSEILNDESKNAQLKVLEEFEQTIENTSDEDYVKNIDEILNQANKIEAGIKEIYDAEQAALIPKP